MSLNRERVVFALLRALYFVGASSGGCLVRFLIVYLDSLHYTRFQMGMLIAFRPLGSFVGSVFFGFLGDWYRQGNGKASLMIISSLSSLCINVLMMRVIHAYFFRTLGVIFFSSLLSANSVLLDAIILDCVRKLEENEKNDNNNEDNHIREHYGKTRVFGAIGWGIGSVACGALIITDRGWMFYFYDGCVIVRLALLFALRWVVSSYSMNLSDDDHSTNKNGGVYSNNHHNAMINEQNSSEYTSVESLVKRYTERKLSDPFQFQSTTDDDPSSQYLLSRAMSVREDRQHSRDEGIYGSTIMNNNKKKKTSDDMMAHSLIGGPSTISQNESDDFIHGDSRSSVTTIPLDDDDDDDNHHCTPSVKVNSSSVNNNDPKCDGNNNMIHSSMYNELRKYYEHWLFLSNLIVFGMAMSLVENYLFLLILDRLRGGSVLLCGLSVAAMVFIGETPVFRFSDWYLERISLPNLLFLSHLSYVARVLFYSVVPWISRHNPLQAWIVLIAEPSHGLTYGISWSANVEYGKRHFPSDLNASIQGLIGELYYGLADAAGSVLGGWLYHHIGPVRMYEYAGFILCGWSLLFRLLFRVPFDREYAARLKLSE